MLSKEEKIKDILEYHPTRNERKYVARYLWAVYRGKQDVISEMEAFGDNIRRIAYNLYAQERALLFGFTELYFDAGWLKYYEWLERKEIEITPNNAVRFNKIMLAKGVNGKWAYGLHYGFGASGGGWSPSIYDEPYNSEKEALTAALNQMVKYFNEALEKAPGDSFGNYNVKFIKAVLAKCNEMLNPKPVQEQFSLFE
ncbi:hypothetical protein [Flavobacterium coralii]|uniref:hypothetical protein n=1 Tax=Flavobacterium coralii TaxID=2838017 RepID=UPI000C5EBC17|nr:hypothetical protein [Flavobacterium sp.]|tara:strand:- start:26125 stop:26718 length:594 start_codon:yes stop_codon:yes gene_type:complete